MEVLPANGYPFRAPRPWSFSSREFGSPVLRLKMRHNFGCCLLRDGDAFRAGPMQGETSSKALNGVIFTLFLRR